MNTRNLRETEKLSVPESSAIIRVFISSNETPTSLELRNAVISLIENNAFIYDPNVFLQSVARSQHPLMLTQYTLEQLRKMRTYTLPGLSIGYALKDGSQGCEIIGVHNNESVVKNIGRHLVLSAISNGGNCLDHFGSEKLNALYSELGFVEVRRDAFNPEYDPHGSFRNRYGELPVIYRQLNGMSKLR